MDAGRIVSLWSGFYPERYRVDEDLVSFNASSLLLPAASFSSDDGFVICKGPHPTFGVAGRAHVSAVAGGEAVLGACRDALVGLGFSSWQFGGDWRHFFPGVPAECSSLAATLASVGMERTGASVYDVERDLSGYEPPVEPSPNARACVLSDAGQLDAFLSREFPGRWHSDVTEKFREEPHRVYVLVLDGQVAGFAMTQREGDLRRRAGAVWSASLGPGWAALGPIGVARSLRGQGHGHGLLAAALCDLRDQGAGRTIIDWTTLTEFYGRHGFVPTREYASFAGRL